MKTITLSETWPAASLHITVAGRCEEAVLRVEAGKALSLVQFVRGLMCSYDPESDLSRLNRCAHIAPLRVHPWTYQALAKAVALSAATEGAFDVTVMPGKISGGTEARHQADTVLNEAGHWNEILLLPDCQVRFRLPLRVDLRSLVAAFAVDKAMDYLGSRLEIVRASVQVGGGMRTWAAAPIS